MSIEALNWARRVGAVGLLRPAEILLLWQLADSADQRDWACWPSQKTLARETNQSLRTVNSQINRLKSLGLIHVEDRRGKGGGRIGLMYYLIEEALDQLLELRSPEISEPGQTKDAASENMSSSEALNANIACRMNPRHANSAFASENGANERHAKVAFESVNRANTRHAKVASGKPKRKLASNPNANSGNSEQVPLKDRARINHHHQSSDAQDASDVADLVTDDDDERTFYRGVDIGQLFSEIPALGGYRHDPALVFGAVDVVLERARGRVANPTAYVRQSLSDDLYGVIASVNAESQSIPPKISHPVGLVAQPTTDENVIKMHPKDQFRKMVGHSPDVPDQPPVPSLRDVPSGAVPCTNLDHLNSYDMSARQLANCNHCRVEQQSGDDAEYPHVTHATDAQIAALPDRLQRWVKQFQSADADGILGIDNSVN